LILAEITLFILTQLMTVMVIETRKTAV